MTDEHRTSNHAVALRMLAERLDDALVTLKPSESCSDALVCDGAADEIERLDRDHRATHKLLLERDREIERLTAWQTQAAETQQAQLSLICKLEDERDRLRAALNGITECEDLDTALMIARAAIKGAADETSGPLKMICNRHGAIIETGCPECEAKVLLRERAARNDV